MSFLPDSPLSNNKSKTVIPENKQNDTVKTIKNLEEIFLTNELELGITMSMIELEDKRIAIGGFGNISIFSYKIQDKQWTREIFKEEVSNKSWINSFCQLPDNKLVSCSGFLIKVWKISTNDITEIITLKGHRDIVRKVISLPNGLLASCSRDKTIRIWNYNSQYQQQTILKHSDVLVSVLYLKKKNVLVSCGEFIEPGVTFWNVEDYTIKRSIKGYGIKYSSHIIELPNGHIVLSSDNNKFPIVIINSSSYRVIKKITINEKITKYSSICALNQDSFICVNQGNVFQVSMKDYSVIFLLEQSNYCGNRCMISVDEGNYFVVQKSKRLVFLKPSFD